VASASLDVLAALRREASSRYFDAHAEAIARLCHALAERFARGGRLLALAATPQDATDAHHVAVEFVHPVIVGKRALPALAVTAAPEALATHVALLAEADDAAIAFGDGPAVAAAVAAAASAGCLTIAFADVGAAWTFAPPSDDPFVRQELAETLYHVVWELVHVFFEHRGLLEGRTAGPVSDAGASSFLYPFLAEQERDVDAVVADVRRSVLAKAEEVATLRERTLAESADAIAAATAALAATFAAGGRVLALGNGGSATDAADLVADLRTPPKPLPSRAALDLADDAAILTALANDVGPELQFSRQVIAYGRPGDLVVAFSTSGSSRNVVEALAEARRRGIATVALVGDDGGRIAADGLADHVVVARSPHIPRIQEAHATVAHLLLELAAGG
jgi:D-sedoheptulose 7-phosphate isomerase